MSAVMTYRMQQVARAMRDSVVTVPQRGGCRAGQMIADMAQVYQALRWPRA
jgi:hypothetical protein